MYASLRIFEVRRAWAPAGAGVTNSLAAVMDKLRSSGVASTFGGHKVPTKYRFFSVRTRSHRAERWV